jgi:hypothetical protein
MVEQINEKMKGIILLMNDCCDDDTYEKLDDELNFLRPIRDQLSSVIKRNKAANARCKNLTQLKAQGGFRMMVDVESATRNTANDILKILEGE